MSIGSKSNFVFQKLHCICQIKRLQNFAKTFLRQNTTASYFREIVFISPHPGVYSHNFFEIFLECGSDMQERTKYLKEVKAIFFSESTLHLSNLQTKVPNKYPEY